MLGMEDDERGDRWMRESIIDSFKAKVGRGEECVYVCACVYVGVND